MWTLDIRKWIKGQEAKIGQVFRSVALEVEASVIARTPVDTGRARGGWQSEMIGNVLSGKGLVFTLVNNVPYILKLEYGGYPPGPKIVGGYSAKSPKGMVRVTMAEFPGIVAKKAASAR